MAAESLEALAARIGHRFNDLSLLREAITHSTFVHEHPDQKPHYERLEFLGDAILSLVVSELLHAHFVQASEGELSRRRAQLVREASLAAWAQRWEVAAHIRLGQGQRAAGLPRSVLADVLEAIVGAVFVDGGLNAARACLAPLVVTRLHEGAGLADAKTQLQELCQRDGHTGPGYRLIDVQGPSHARRFVMEVCIDGEVLGRGEASSKKAAEQRCAEGALAALQQGSRRAKSAL